MIQSNGLDVDWESLQIPIRLREGHTTKLFNALCKLKTACSDHLRMVSSYGFFFVHCTREFHEKLKIEDEIIQIY